MPRICSNPDCQRETYLPADLCPYCHKPVVEIHAEVKSQSAAASPKQPARPVKPWVAPTREEPKPEVAEPKPRLETAAPVKESKPNVSESSLAKESPRKIPVKLDREFIWKNIWFSLLVALAAGLLFVRADIAYRESRDHPFSFSGVGALLAVIGGFLGMQLVRWRRACRPDSRLMRWLNRTLLASSLIAVCAGLVGVGLSLLIQHLSVHRWDFEEAPMWASSLAWIGVIVGWVVGLFPKHGHVPRHTKSEPEYETEGLQRLFEECFGGHDGDGDGGDGGGGDGGGDGGSD